MCDLWENSNNPCRDTTELFFNEEKPKNIELKIKTEHIDDEETGQIRDKQIFPDQTKAEVKVEEGEAGADQMSGDWKIKNEELDIKEDESETSENRLQIHQPCHNRVGHKLNSNNKNVPVLFRPRNFDRYGLRKDPAKVNKFDHCDFKTKYKYNLHKHLLYKAPGDVIMFKCSQCAYQTKRKRDMFKCTQCAYQTKSKKYLNRHLFSHKDPGEVVNMFKCTQCAYQTKRKSSLNRHFLQHTDPAKVNMFKCSQCDYQTKLKNSLTRHLLRHKDPGEVNMFKCTHCAYETKFKGYLKIHFLRHKDPGEVSMFKCTHCSYETKFKGHLKSHFLRHKDPGEVNMFKCTHCAYQTKFKFHLKSHFLRHKGPAEVDVL